MFGWVLAGVALLIVAAAVGTGSWRVLLRLFCINPKSMGPVKLGFKVSRPQDLSRVEGICSTFAGGFNEMFAGRSWRDWSDYVDSLPVFFRPFAEEGAAMGYSLRNVGRFSPIRFEESLVQARPGYRYLHYVGLGFWNAMCKRSPASFERIVNKLDPLLGMLCWDGYGFKFGFFDYRKEAHWKSRFESLNGYAVHAAYQGMGRSLWFRFMDDPAELIRQIESFGRHSGDAAAGTGLATVFTTVDRPQRGLELLERMPQEWQSDVSLGMCFAYKARSISDPEFFADSLKEYPGAAREAIEAAIEHCDHQESLIRREGVVSDSYRRWRESVTMWLGERVEYPFVRLKSDNPSVADHVAVSAESGGV